MFRILIGALVLMGYTCATAPAQQKTSESSQSQTLEEKLQAFLKRFPESDLNQDGQLTREEVREFNIQRRKNRVGDRVQDRQRPEPTVADFAYGDHEKQCFDLWAVPLQKGGAGNTDMPTTQNPTPLVIYIHGGGFRGGDKRAFNPAVIEDYHNRGIAFASMNYRLSDVGPYPIMMMDAARGLQTIRYHAAKWNIDPDRIACFGGSAGAGISLWLAFHDDLAEPESDDPIARQSTRIRAAATSNGQSTYDLFTYRDWFEVPDLAPHEAMFPLYDVKNPSDWRTPRVRRLMKDASPITHLSADDDAPVYMTYNRPNVPVTKETNQSVWVHHYRLGAKLKTAMEALGKECHVVSRGDRKKDVAFASIADFLEANLRPSQDKPARLPKSSLRDNRRTADGDTNGS